MFRNYHRNESASDRKYRLLNEAVPAGFKMGRTLQGKSLAAGMKVLAYYNEFNEGVDVVEILGVTNNDAKYGEGGVQFQTVKDMLDHHGLNTLSDVENLDHTREDALDDYGYHTYLCVRDISEENGESGPWYYVFEGRWARCSGAEKLSFVELITDAEYATTQAKTEEERRVEFAKRMLASKKAMLANLQAEIADLESLL